MITLLKSRQRIFLSWKIATFLLIVNVSLEVNFALPSAPDEVHLTSNSFPHSVALHQQDDKAELRNLLRNRLNDRMQHYSHPTHSSSANVISTSDARLLSDKEIVSTGEKRSSNQLRLDMHTLLGTNVVRKLTADTPKYYVIKEDAKTRFMYAEVGSSLKELETNATIVPCSVQHPNLESPIIVCSSHGHNLQLNATKITTPKDQPNQFKYLDYTGNEVMIQIFNSTQPPAATPANDSTEPVATTSLSDSTESFAATPSNESLPMFRMNGVKLSVLLGGGFIASFILVTCLGYACWYCCRTAKTRGKGLLDEEQSVGDGVKIGNSRKKQKNRFSANAGTDESVTTSRTTKTKNTSQPDFLGRSGNDDQFHESFNVHNVMSGLGELDDGSERSHVSIYFEDEENQDQSELYDDSEASYRGVKQSSWFSTFWRKPITEPKPSAKGGGRNKRISKSDASVGGSVSTAVSSTK